MLKRSAIITFFIIILPFSTSFSWESDFHYGLIKWLSVKAGFNIDDSEIIAAGSESADESNVLKASVVVPIYACLGESNEASRHVQQHHFPSDGFVPSSRINRDVKPGNPNEKNAGNLWIRYESNQKIINMKHRNTYLNRLGQALHPLADSWAHRGVPDKIPLICSEERVWAHSEERGGYGSHDADLTHKYPKDAIESAEANFHYLKIFLGSNPTLRNSKSSHWDDIKDRVEAFAIAETAFKKKDWFDKNEDVPLHSYTTYPCFLKNTSLPGSNKICENKSNENDNESREKNNTSYRKNDLDPSEFFHNLLNSWIVEQNIDRLINESLNSQIIMKGIIGRESIAKDQSNKLIKIILEMWLIEDHGLVNNLGHGFPYRQGFSDLSSMTQISPKLKFNRLIDAIHYPGSSIPFIIKRVDEAKFGPDVFASIFQFHHLPRDTIVIIARKSGWNWEVIGFTWVVL